MIKYSESLKDTLKMIKAGESLVLSVNIVGTPTPKASWWFKDSEIKSGLDVSVEGDGTFSRLTVKNTTGEATGMYKVVAENSVGSDTAEFDVVILGQFITISLNHLKVYWKFIAGSTQFRHTLINIITYAVSGDCRLRCKFSKRS